MVALDWGNIFKSRILWIVVACIAGIGLLAYILSSVNSCRFNSGVNKKKEAVNTAIKEIGNINTQIANLELKKAEKVVEIKRDTEDLMKEVYGREEAKKAANAAIANYERAVHSNANVDVTAEDIERKLRELEK